MIRNTNTIQPAAGAPACPTVRLAMAARSTGAMETAAVSVGTTTMVEQCEITGTLLHGGLQVSSKGKIQRIG